MKLSQYHIVWIKVIIHTFSLIFFIILVQQTLSGGFGADPVKGIEHFTGKAALNTLLITLIVSPVAKWLKQGILFKVRRLLGIYCFFWGLIHLIVYLSFDLNFNWALLGSEIILRPYLTVGVMCLLILLLLSITSTRKMQRRLGHKWQQLHNWVYIALVLAVIHYYMSVKSGVLEPSIYISVAFVLLLIRWKTIKQRLPYPFNVLVESKFPKEEKFWEGGELVCVKTKLETHDVKSYVFRAKEMIKFKYKSGQFVTIAIKFNGKKHYRNYSISTSPSSSNIFITITVKAIKNGLVSNWLFNNLNVGDSIDASHPTGKFIIPEIKTKKYLFLSAGSGISPCMSMAQDLLDNNIGSDIIFINSAKSYKDIIFDEQLKAAEHNSLKFKRINILEEMNSSNFNTHYGRLSQEHLNKFVPDLHDRAVLSCGPGNYMASIKLILISSNFNFDNFYEEKFYSPGIVAKSDKQIITSSYDLKILNYNKTIKVKSNQTILEALELENIPINSACRGGICGTCKCKKVDGKIEYSTKEGLSNDDFKKDFILSCVSFIKSDSIIDIPST